MNHAEIYEECVPCGSVRAFFVHGGTRTCSNCGWQPDSQPRRNPKPVTVEPEYDQRAYSECPECYELRLFSAAQGHLICRACGWEGSDVDVERDLSRENSARDCFFEDTRRGKRGGGSKSGKGRKKPTKPGERMERMDCDSTTVTESLRGPRRNVISLPGINESAEFIRAAIADKMLAELLAEGGAECRLDA